MGNYRAETEKTSPEFVPNAIEQGDQVSLENPVLDEICDSEGAELKKQVLRKTNKRRKMRICIISISLVILILIGLGSACVFRNPSILTYPLHASCKITWTLASNCSYVADSLVRQIDTWRTNETCGTGQKCLYNLESTDGNVLKVTHKTPVRFYIDDMTYSFYPNPATKGCNLVGFSSSRIWYAFLDLGTNYCNLHNLLEGAGLMQDPLYSELTRDEICTQYTSSNCDKY